MQKFCVMLMCSVEMFMHVFTNFDCVLISGLLHACSYSQHCHCSAYCMQLQSALPLQCVLHVAIVSTATVVRTACSLQSPHPQQCVLHVAYSYRTHSSAYCMQLIVTAPTAVPTACSLLPHPVLLPHPRPRHEFQLSGKLTQMRYVTSSMITSGSQCELMHLATQEFLRKLTVGRQRETRVYERAALGSIIVPGRKRETRVDERATLGSIIVDDR